MIEEEVTMLDIAKGRASIEDRAIDEEHYRREAAGKTPLKESKLPNQDFVVRRGLSKEQKRKGERSA